MSQQILNHRGSNSVHQNRFAISNIADSGLIKLVKHSNDGRNLVFNEDIDEQIIDNSTIKLACCIIGPIGSGKSTLLNQTFNTRFLLGRSGLGPRTSGIVMQVREDGVILDVEGFDSSYIMDNSSEDIQLLVNFYAMICSNVIFIRIQEITSYHGSRIDYIAHLIYCLIEYVKKTNKMRIIYFIYKDAHDRQSLESYSESIKYFINLLERVILSKYQTEDNFRLEKYLKIKPISQHSTEIKYIVHAESLLKKGKFFRDYFRKCHDKFNIAKEVYYGIKYKEISETDSRIVKRRINHSNYEIRFDLNSNNIEQLLKLIVILIVVAIGVINYRYNPK